MKIKEIARGSVCRVYKADAIDASFALKIFATDSFESFDNEINIDKIRQQLFYENVQCMYNGHLYPIIKMDYYPLSLKKFIRKTNNDYINLKLEIAKKLGQEIAKLHELGITHCDIKPGNIMIDVDYDTLLENQQDFNVHLIDFGLSAIGTHQFMDQPGTRHYMAPEILRCDEYGPDSDWWSYACVIFEMVTGVTLFDYKNEDGTIYDADDFADSESDEIQSDTNSDISLEPYSDEETDLLNDYHFNLIDYIAVDANNHVEEVCAYNIDPNLLDNDSAISLLELIKNNLTIDPEYRQGC